MATEPEENNRAPNFDLTERTACFGENVIQFCQTIRLNAINSPLVSQLVRSATSSRGELWRSGRVWHEEGVSLSHQFVQTRSTRDQTLASYGRRCGAWAKRNRPCFVERSQRIDPDLRRNPSK